MAIAPSKLGRIVARHWHSADGFVRALRDEGLARRDAADSDLIATVERARQEHATLDDDFREFNSPEERVRVYLEPHLTDKGRRWAEPLTSLDSPD
jgi:hypothetical protein